jgi:hypothetical protein
MRRFLLAAVCLLAVALIGCQGSPFPQDTPRTPYERYQGLHGRYREAGRTGARSSDDPRLRERLSGLREP